MSSFRETVRQFAQAEIVPHTAAGEHDGEESLASM